MMVRGVRNSCEVMETKSRCRAVSRRSFSKPASKAAAWSMVNSLRQELADQGTTVSALHVGYMDTDMAAAVTDPKSDPSDVARLAIEGIEGGAAEILADEISTFVRGQLGDGVAGLYPQFA